MIFRVDKRIAFPPPSLAEEDGLLAIGGDLSQERLLLAYQNGIFPWYSEDTPIMWYSPHQRLVIYANELHVSSSMSKFLKKQPFIITQNQAFEQVIKACANIERKDQDGTWIIPDMIAAYTNLFKKGYAQSVEVWQNGELVGGTYGIPINKVFCGESMFSKANNASKAALIHLLTSGKYDLLDCQMPTEHLASLGGKMISREEYMQALQNC